MSKYVGGENLGEALHVALRKGCDSPSTSAAHICVGLMPNSLWGEYVKVVDYYLGRAKEKKVLTEKNAWEHLKFVSVQEPTETFIDAREAARQRVTQWIADGRVGEKPKYPIPYEPVSSKWYDPGTCFSADRNKKDSGTMEFLRSLPDDEAARGSVEELIRVRDRYRYLFHSILRTFSDGDWKGYACFLFQ